MSLSELHEPGPHKRPRIGKEGFSAVADPSEADVDIIFVHGLQGHPEKTWTHESPPRVERRRLFRRPRTMPDGPQGGVFWPYDFLSRNPQLARARILTWGYDSHVTKFFSANNQQNISRHGSDLMVALEQERKDDPSRPLIFVAHSLGGILVKIALDNSQRTKQPKFLQLYQSTKGVVFLGTPHSGSDAANWALLASNLAKFALQDSNESVLKALTPNNELLERLREGFLQMLEDGNFSIHSFYETKGMTGTYGMQGAVVPFESAKVGHVRYEVLMGINGNHSEICKFATADDPGYRAVSGAIIDYVKEATKGKQPTTQGADAQSSAPEAASSLEDSMTILGGCLGSKYSSVIVRQKDPVEGEATVSMKGFGKEAAKQRDDAFSQYISALSLPEFPYLELQTESSGSIDSASEGLDWFFENPDFMDWDSSSLTAILWLRGKSRWENSRVLSCLLRKLLYRGEQALYFLCPPSFEFDGGVKPEDQALQIVRMLIRQLLDDSESRLQYAMQQYPIPEVMKASLYPSRPGLLLLKHFFAILFYSLVAQPDSRIYLVIDGIDMLGPEMYRFLDRLLDLHSKLMDVEDERNVAVKLFFTTRSLDISQPLNDLEQSLNEIPSIEKDKELKDCLQALHAADFDARPKTIQDAESFTCQWLWTDDAYLQWQSAKSSSLLLIRGKPGSGKSTLAKHILKEIPKSSNGDPDNNPKVLTAHFFYSFRGGRTETSHKVMLQSILHQLLDQEHSLYVLFRDHYRAQRRFKGRKFQWELPVLRDILMSLARVETDLRVYIVLDAMDESDDQERHEILDALMALCSSTSQCVIKGLVTTRPLPKKDLGPQIREFPSLILEEKNRKDIEEIVDREIERITADVINEDGTIENTVFDGIKSHIKNHAGGVFLWVNMVLKEVKNLADEGFSKADLDQLWKILPPELKDLYKRIIERLAKNSSERRINEGRKMLASATFSLRSLTVDELRDAIAVPSILDIEQFDPTPAYFDRRIELLERRIPLTCGDLLEVKKPFVQLVHESVREFLLRKDKIAAPFSTDEQSGKDEIASVCTRYVRLSLSQQMLESAGVSTESVGLWKAQDYEAFVRLLDDRPFLDYAISSLPKHLEMAKSKRVSDECLFFLGEALALEPAWSFLWESLMPLVRKSPSYSQRELSSQFRVKALIAAATGGYLNAVKPLVTAGTSVDSIDEETGAFPLLAAVMAGHEQVAKLLLDLHSNPNTKDRYAETALHKAASHAQKSIAELLLRKGAYVDVENLVNERPLHLAAVHGHSELVCLLIENHADVNAIDLYGGTPLHKAAANGHHEVAMLLLAAGAFANINAEYRGTPLHRAVDNEDEAMVYILLQENTDVDFEGSYGGTALHCASAGGQEKIVSLLLKYGANFMAKDRYGRTPCEWAVANGHMKIVQLLLDNRASDSTSSTASDPSQLLARVDEYLPGIEKRFTDLILKYKIWSD